MTEDQEMLEHSREAVRQMRLTVDQMRATSAEYRAKREKEAAGREREDRVGNWVMYSSMTLVVVAFVTMLYVTLPYIVQMVIKSTHMWGELLSK